MLVVDDHSEICTFLRIALEQAGYEIQEAHNEKDVMERLRITPCDLVLTDMVMPDGKGTQLCLDLTKEFPDTPDHRHDRRQRHERLQLHRQGVRGSLCSLQTVLE